MPARGALPARRLWRRPLGRCGCRARPRSALAPCATASPMLPWPGSRSRPAARQSLAYALPAPAALVAVLRTGCATAPSIMHSAGRVPPPLSVGTRAAGAPTRPRTWTARCRATLAGTRSAWAQTPTASSGLQRYAAAGRRSAPLAAGCTNPPTSLLALLRVAACEGAGAGRPAAASQGPAGVAGRSGPVWPKLKAMLLCRKRCLHNMACTYCAPAFLKNAV